MQSHLGQPRLASVAENVGIEGIVAQGCEEAVLLGASEYPLENILPLLLKNAERNRLPDTPLTLSLSHYGQNSLLRPCITLLTRFHSGRH